MKIQPVRWLHPNSNAVGNLYIEMKKDFPEAVNWYFLLKIGILCVRSIRKKFPSLRHEFLPIDPPTTQYYYIRVYENSWLRICYCTISNMFCVRLHSSLHLNCQNCPNLSLTNLQLTFLRFFKKHQRSSSLSKSILNIYTASKKSSHTY